MIDVPPCDRCHQPVDDEDDEDFDEWGVWKCQECGALLCDACVEEFVYEPGYCGDCWQKPPPPMPAWLLETADQLQGH